MNSSSGDVSNLRRSEGLDVVLVAEIDDPLDADPLQNTVNDEYFVEPLRLIRPPHPIHPPHLHMLGLVCLATWLKRQGFTVQAFDNIFAIPSSREGFLSALDRGPRAVGISTTFMRSTASIARIARAVRERCPQALLILGGLSAERRSEVRALGDVTVCGLGEKTLSDILSCLKRGADWRGLPNLIYRQGTQEVCTPQEKNFSFEQRPNPDWDVLPVQPSQDFIVQTSSGCRYRCVFCTNPELGSQDRPWSTRVVSAIRDAHERFAATRFRFAASNFTSWPEETEALCTTLAAQNLPIEWSCNARVDNFVDRPSLAAAMVSAGCRWVSLGIESGCDEILRSMRKQFDRRDILEGIRIAKEAGLRIYCSSIIGFPGETARTVDQTLEVVDLCRPDIASFLVLCIYADNASDIARHPDRYGLTGTLTRWSHATMDSEEARRQARRCYQEVTLRMDRPLLGVGTPPFALRGFGLSEEESLSYLRGIRDFHRAKLKDDAAGLQAALAVIRLGDERLRQAYEAEGWQGPSPAQIGIGP